MALNKTYSVGQKVGVVYTMGMYNSMVRQGLNKTKPPKLLPDRYAWGSTALLFARSHPMYEVFDRKLQQYIEADLINYCIREYHDDNNPKRLEEYEEPFAVLTLEELEAGFVVCMVPLVLSLFVFGIECILTLVNFVPVIFVFNSYFKVKRAMEKENIELMKFKAATAKTLLEKKDNGEFPPNVLLNLKATFNAPRKFLKIFKFARLLKPQSAHHFWFSPKKHSNSRKSRLIKFLCPLSCSKIKNFPPRSSQIIIWMLIT